MNSGKKNAPILSLHAIRHSTYQWKQLWLLQRVENGVQRGRRELQCESEEHSGDSELLRSVQKHCEQNETYDSCEISQNLTGTPKQSAAQNQAKRWSKP